MVTTVTIKIKKEDLAKIKDLKINPHVPNHEVVTDLLEYFATQSYHD